MLSVTQALEVILRGSPLTGSEMLPLGDACGRVLADSILSSRDVPPFANSAMDGFAVRHADLDGKPTRLRVLEMIPAGRLPAHVVAPGCAAKIMTGAVMPAGADTVVRVEDTAEEGELVVIRIVPKSGANVRYAGEDVKAGEVVLHGGRRLRPADIGVLASVGHAVVRVRCRPQVAILATGDELVEVGQPVAPGQIVNSNAPTLAAAVAAAGGMPRLLGIVPDDEQASLAYFEQALGADMVLSTGGVSMGVLDLVRATLARLGVIEEFWKVAQKPGKPLAFGRRGPTSVFGLPGNPVSALVCFYVYVVPAIRQRLGLADLHYPTIEASAAEDMRASAGLTDFIRCVIEGKQGGYQVRSTGTQSSGVLRSLSLGDGLLVAGPEVTEITRGSKVRVIRLVDEMDASPAYL